MLASWKQVEEWRADLRGQVGKIQRGSPLGSLARMPQAAKLAVMAARRAAPTRLLSRPWDGLRRVPTERYALAKRASARCGNTGHDQA